MTSHGGPARADRIADGDGGGEESPDQEPLSSDVFTTIRRFAGGAAGPMAGVFSVVEQVFAQYQREARLFREEKKHGSDGLPAPTDLPNLLSFSPPAEEPSPPAPDPSPSETNPGETPEPGTD